MRLRVALALSAIALSGSIGCRGCGRGSRAGEEGHVPIDAGGALVVPRASGPLIGDGDLDEPAWKSPARTGSFVDDGGKLARPYSDARFLWDDGNLYVALYAADEDLRKSKAGHDGPLWTGDAFTMRLGVPSGDYELDFGVDGTITDARVVAGKLDTSWESGAKAATEHDGTIDDPGDDDEEWLVEAQIPWKSMGLTPARGTRITIDLRRCDVPKSGKRVCAGWKGEAVLGD